VIYSQEIVIPLNTLEGAPISRRLDIVEGVIKRVWVRWRWGSANLCGAAIYRGGFQVWPSSGDEWFPSSIRDTEFTEEYEVNDEPLHFIVRAYNVDDTYDHTLWVGMSVLRGSMTGKLFDMLRVLGGKADVWQK